MRRLSPHLIVFTILSLLFSTGVAWADPYAYIPSYDNDLLVRIDTTNDGNSASFDSVSLKSGSSATCGPHGVAVAPDGQYIFVTCETGDALVAVSSSMQQAGVWIQDAENRVDQPRGVAVDPKGLYVYTANFVSNNVAYGLIANGSIDDVLDNAQANFNNPWGIAAIYDESASEEEGAEVRKIYVANNGNNTVTVITQTGGSTFAYATVSGYDGNAPIGVTATPNGRYVYVANSSSMTVSKIDTSTDRQIGKTTVGSEPWGVAVGAMGNYLYVTNSGVGANTVTIIDINSGTNADTVVGTKSVGTTPNGIAAPKNGDFAYAVNHAGTVPIRKIWVESSGTDRDIQDDGDPDIRSPYALGTFIGGTPPTAPSNLTATVDGDDTIELTWSDNSSNELGFKIERRILGEGTWGVDLIGKDKESYTDYNLSPETTYEYRIRAYTEAADSAYATLSGDEEGVTTESSKDFSWCFIGSLF